MVNMVSCKREIVLTFELKNKAVRAGWSRADKPLQSYSTNRTGDLSKSVIPDVTLIFISVYTEKNIAAIITILIHIILF